ncbi:MAG: hypothetical protein CL927_19675 [Deltaproteobacteria bacterium]|nr:hypothetical protein [Deltaproteobacteria bacterium]
MRRTPLLIAICGMWTACGGAKVLDISVEQQGCESLDQGEQPPSALVRKDQGNNITIYRDWVFIASTAEFDPEFAQDGKDITVREYWNDEEGGSGVETCFRPTIVLNNPESGKFNLFWYIGGDGTPFDNMEIDID